MNTGKIVIAILLISTGIASIALYQAISYESPRLEIDRPIRRLGEIQQGSVVDVDFKLTNYHSRPLSIDHAWSSCSCTTPVISNPVLQPGESCEIRTSWKTSGMRGEQATRIMLLYQVEGQPKQEGQLFITGTVVPRLKVSPYPIRLKVGSPDPITILVRDSGNPTLPGEPIRDAVPNHRAFVVENLQGDSFEMKVDRERFGEVGSLNYVTIVSNDPNDPYIRIPIEVDGGEFSQGGSSK
jgi:hypothetical protein